MSPAHARLASLASDMDNGQHNSISQGFDSSNLGPYPADYNVALDIPGAEAWQVSADELVGGADNFAFGHGFDGGEDEEHDDDEGNNNHQDGMWQPLSGLATLPGRSKERAAPIGGKWTSAEDNALKLIVQQHGPKNWKKASATLGSSTVEMPVQIYRYLHAFTQV